MAGVLTTDNSSGSILTNVSDYPGHYKDVDFGYTHARNAVEFVLCTCGVVFNLVVIIRLLHVCCQGSMKAFLRFVLNLSACDFAIALCHILRMIFPLMTFWDLTNSVYEPLVDYHNVILIVLFSYLYLVVQTVALMTMFYVAVDLLILVKWPLRYTSIMTSTKGTKLVVSSWIVGCVLWIGILMLSLYKTEYTGIAAVIVNGVPMSCAFIAFLIIYGVIVWEIRKLHQRAPSRQLRTMVKSTITVACILLTYFICMMPYMWLFVVISFYWNEENINLVYLIDSLRFLFVVNTICDPIIYSIRVPELRDKLKTFFKSLKCVKG